jgi:hypothetical protein
MALVTETAIIAFNRGIVDKRGLARGEDIKRVAFAAEKMENWVARVLGSMMLRPGLGYLGNSQGNNAARHIPFIFGTSDTAVLEFTDSTLRVWNQDALITRAAVATTVANGLFIGNLASWTQADEAGATSSWAAGNLMQLVGTGINRAIRYQQLAVAAPDQATEHALRVVVNNGPVILRVGTAINDDSLVGATTLDTGTFSLAFTPNAANVYVQFESSAQQIITISQCTIEAAGVMTLPSPYLAANLSAIRYDQSGDVVFLACSTFQQRQIQRRGTRPNARSWGICLYRPSDGPFLVQNIGPLTITPSAASGNITLTASQPLFRAGYVGSLMSITASSELVQQSLGGANQFSSALLVTGVGAARSFMINVSGTWSATITVQQSIGVTGNWTDYQTIVANESNVTVADGLDNQTVYYRIGIKAGNYTSGTAITSLTLNSGIQRGIVRITAFTDSTHVNAEVLTTLGATAATSIWQLATWSTTNGWPTAVRIFQGRLWWAGQNGILGSVSDGYSSYDETVIGDSGPINRTIGSGPVDNINWIIDLQRLLLGSEGAEYSARSDSFDDPITPTNFNIKASSTQGSAAVMGVKIDSDGIYIQRGGARVFLLEFDLQSYDYKSKHITEICPEFGSPGIVRMAVQRQPDTRVHCVRSDGTVMLGVFDKEENVICWCNITTPGLIEDVVVLPALAGNFDDQVYYSVKRTINGATVRYFEKWAQEAEAKGTTMNKQGDAFITYTGAAITHVTGLGALEGQSVVVWADGKDVGTQSTQTDVTTFTRSQKFVVTGGALVPDLAVAASNIMVGLPYTAPWQSGKFAQAISGIGSALTRQKKLDQLGLIMTDVHAQGLQYGIDFDNLYDLPQTEEGQNVDPDAIRSEYDYQSMEMMGEWDTDARLCLQAAAPRPVTVSAAVIPYEMRS